MHELEKDSPNLFQFIGGWILEPEYYGLEDLPAAVDEFIAIEDYAVELRSEIAALLALDTLPWRAIGDHLMVYGRWQEEDIRRWLERLGQVLEQKLTT